jgi:hypothetical protein
VGTGSDPDEPGPAHSARFELDYRNDMLLWLDSPDDQARWGQPADVTLLPISDNLRHELHALGAWYDTSLDFTDPQGPCPWTLDEHQRFAKAVRQTLQRLRAELGQTWDIIDIFGGGRDDAVWLVEWAEALAWHELAEPLPRRLAHVSSVAAEALRISGLLDHDEAALLVAAAWLHDIGYAPRLATTGFHPVDGARFVAASGESERLCALIARHSCAIREAHLRGRLDDVAAYPDEQTPLRDALWYCDMVTGPDGQRLTVHDRLAEIHDRYGPDSLIGRFITEARPELVGAVDRTLTRMTAAGISPPDCT